MSSKPHVVNVTTSDDLSTRTFEFKYRLRQHRPGQPTSIVTGDWYLILDTAKPAESRIHRTYGVRIAFPTCIGYWQCQTIRQDMDLSAAQCSVSPDGRSGD